LVSKCSCYSNAYVYVIIFDLDATRVIAAVGNRVLLYDAESGNLLDSLRGHKDTVLSVSWSFDGTRFASGGADRVVVIWKSSGQGLLKYNHTSPVQRVRYNPNAMLLASCADDDFGYWTPEQKQVLKDKIPSKSLSAAWNADGSLLALGMQNGHVSIRNMKTEEISRIERTMPVWCLTFAMGIVTTPSSGGKGNPTTTTDMEVLMVGCWDKTVSAYKIILPNNNVMVPAQKTTERNVKFYPTSISITGGLYSKNSFMLISGANKKCILFSRDCMKLTEIASKSSWVWSCATPFHGTSSTKMALGADNGDIEVLNLRFDNVFGINSDRYAFRENLTEIVVQHLITDRKVRIKCRDLVQKLALYRNKLAVQVSDKVFIYESNIDDLTDIHFRLKKERVTHNIVSERMGVTTNCLVFSNANILSLYSFDGTKLRSWTFDSSVKYFKVDTGLEDMECVIISLLNGCIYKIYIDNPFPLEIAKRETAVGGAVQSAMAGKGKKNKGKKPNGVICVDMNLHRTMLATVDEEKNLVVSELSSGEVLFKYTGVVYVCFNQEVDDMLCFSTDTAMFVCSGLAAVSSGGGAPTVSATTGRGRGRDRGGEGGEDSLASRPARSQPGEEIIPQEQHIGGPATGLIFSGQRIFCLYRGLMTNLDIPQGTNIQQAIEQNDYENAYHLACLGATSADWKLLGMRALRANQLVISKNCFARLQDTKFLSLLDAIEQKSGGASGSAAPAPKSPEQRRNARNKGAVESKIGLDHPPLDASWQAELLAYEGHPNEAAKIYARANQINESIRLLTELRRWNDAKLFAQNALSAGGSSNAHRLVDLNDLTLKQAKWLQEINDWRGAAELHLTLSQYMLACKIIVESNAAIDGASGTPAAFGTAPGEPVAPWKSYLLDVMRRVPKEQSEVLNYCGDSFVAVGEDDMARETYTKLGNISKLMFLFGRKQLWTEAAKLAEEHPGEFDCSVFLPYAEWLLTEDRFMDAMHAYKRADRKDLGRRVLEELTYNSVVESRFKDAAYYYWLLSREYEATAVELATARADGGKLLRSGRQGEGSADNAFHAKEVVLSVTECEQQVAECTHKADLYYAYATIHSYVMDPFTVHQAETLFQTCRFLINSLGSNPQDGAVPYGISKASVYYTLAKQAMKLSCYKLARHSFERLGKLQLSLRKHEDEIDLDMLIVQAKPVLDNPDYAPACYRCGVSNALLNPFTNKHAKGDVCASCGHPFVRSFINFDILPLVEFVPDPSITDEEAIELVRSAPEGDNAQLMESMRKSKENWRESKEGQSNVLSLDDDVEEDYNADMLGDTGATRYSTMGGDEDPMADLFTKCLNRTLDRQHNAGYIPVTVDANALLSIKRSEVFVCKPSSKHKRATFYR